MRTTLRRVAAVAAAAALALGLAVATLAPAVPAPTRRPRRPRRPPGSTGQLHQRAVCTTDQLRRFDDYGLSIDAGFCAELSTGNTAVARRSATRSPRTSTTTSPATAFGDPAARTPAPRRRRWSRPGRRARTRRSFGGVDLVSRLESLVGAERPDRPTISTSGRPDFANTIGQSFAVARAHDGGQRRGRRRDGVPAQAAVPGRLLPARLLCGRTVTRAATTPARGHRRHRARGAQRCRTRSRSPRSTAAIDQGGRLAVWPRRRPTAPSAVAALTDAPQHQQHRPGRVGAGRSCRVGGREQGGGVRPQLPGAGRADRSARHRGRRGRLRRRGPDPGQSQRHHRRDQRPVAPRHRAGRTRPGSGTPTATRHGPGRPARGGSSRPARPRR